MDGLLLSRPLLESAVRRRVQRLENVRILEGCQAAGLLSGTKNGRIEGVRCAWPGETEEIRADLTVDASGRGSRSPEWLAGLGYDIPPEDRVTIEIGYTTRLFRRSPRDLGGDLIVVIPPLPEVRQGGVMLAQEGDRWIVTLTSRFGNYAPEDLDGFREFARSLHARDIYDGIRNAEPLREARSGRFPASIRRRYEKMARFPEGYLVFGDALCSFNPVYGQGMSVAALESLELTRCLREGNDRLAARFFASAGKIVDIPWRIAVGNDLKIPQATGKRTLGLRFANWYMSKLHRAAHSDPVTSLAFHRVANLLAPPSSVMTPRMAVRVLAGNLRRPHGDRCSGRAGESAAPAARSAATSAGVR